MFGLKEFTLVLSRPDDPAIWAPYIEPNRKVLVTLSGRIALDNEEWERAKKQRGKGGLACKAIYKMYKSGGVDNLENLNGNYVVIIYDPEMKQIHIVTDRCGMFPCFSSGMVFSSHPDVLATVLGISHDWDMVSMAEFIMTGKVSFPYSYYRNIKALDFGSVHTISLDGANAVYKSKKKYFTFDFKIDHELTEWDLAEELANAFKKAVRKRTLEIFGQSAISLSGGLDSRTILCSIREQHGLLAICFFDEKNIEYKIAEKIANEANIEFIALKREPDYYGNSAEEAVRISGGMGWIIGNHYLGFRDLLKKLEIHNLITGFYCDYFFKGLLLNKKINKFLRTEVFSPFEYEIEYPYFWFDTSYSNRVKQRLDHSFPESLRNDQSEIAKLRIEEKRIFPLFNEPDNTATLVPQKVMSWYLPIVDNDIIDIYLKMPPKYKLNTSMYSKMVEVQCGERFSQIPNCNTGARVNASRISLFLHRNKKAIERQIKGTILKSVATDHSWPNWEYYAHHSEKVRSLWMRKNDVAQEIFAAIMGKDPYQMEIQKYRGKGVDLFFRLLTLKLWLDQRV
ncbi:MAG: asparagine synthase-related protein [Candidatus Hodarchaeota archaeon]